jgi:endogenous inhibitor of DNA gyrase (YacG/DUF329 family)
MTVPCDTCGATLTRIPAKVGERNYCGRTCTGLGRRRRAEVPCAQCGATLIRTPAITYARSFCGKSCKARWFSTFMAGADNPAWLGGHVDYRGPNWNTQRKAALDRDNRTCQHCDKVGGYMTVNHIRPYHLFDNYREANVLANLETLCSRCHGKAEIAFWRANPHLIVGRKFPDAVPERQCDQCGITYAPRSPASKLCDGCREVTCQHCGKRFTTTRAARVAVMYCGTECSNIGRGLRGWRNRPNPRRMWAARHSKT